MHNIDMANIEFFCYKSQNQMKYVAHYVIVGDILLGVSKSRCQHRALGKVIRLTVRMAIRMWLK